MTPGSLRCARFALLLLSTLVAIALTEFLLRTFVEQETKRLAVYDKDLGWRGRPWGRGDYVRRKDKIRVPFTYNNLGFRDEDLVEKQSRFPRILMLGDSFLESLEVPYEDIFHERVERRLQQLVHADADVAAIGSQGYSNAQQLLAFRRYKDSVTPDIVLSIFYSGNDFEDNLRRKFAYLDDNRILRFPPNNDSTLRIQQQRFKRWLYESSHLVFLLKNRLESLTQFRLDDPSKVTDNRGDDYKREITTEILAQTSAEVEACGAEYAVIVIPSRDELTQLNDTWIRTVTSFCQQEDIAYLDLWDTLSEEHYYQADFHLNVTGHAATANAIYGFIVREFVIARESDRSGPSEKVAQAVINLSVQCADGQDCPSYSLVAASAASFNGKPQAPAQGSESPHTVACGLPLNRNSATG